MRILLGLLAVAAMAEAPRSSLQSKSGNSVASEIEAREHKLWDAYKNRDIETHNAILADDYAAVFPDGTLHTSKPTAQQIAAAPMTSYSFAHYRVVPLAPATALVTYVAQVEGPVNGQTVKVRYAVGEVWQQRKGVWLCRYYQGTIVK